MRSIRTVLVLITVSLIVACAGESERIDGNRGSSDSTTYKIAVIPKGTSHVFWKAVHAGALAAESEHGVEIVWLASETEDDRKQQIDVVQNFIAGGVDAIVLAPLDEVALATPVELAVSRGIPVVIIDSALQSDAHSSFVATDNAEGGRRAAGLLGSLMTGEGKAIMLRYNPGSASTHNREEGFLAEMASRFPGIELVSTNQYGGVTKQSAMEASQILLNTYGDEIQGIFCPNESSTFGMLRALENSGRAGRIFFVGFDASSGLVDGLKSGAIHGLVAQDPFGMGYRGVATAVSVLRGEDIEKLVATRLTVVTPDNVDSDEIRQIIEPEIRGL